MKTIAGLSVCAVLLAGCTAGATSSSAPPDAPPDAAPPAVVRVVLVGDVMLGRGIARSAAADPDALFAEVRHLLRSPDVAGANLESPLTARPVGSPIENDLSADPSMAAVLSEAGFDLVSLPNNHATDAGPDGLLDTIAAAEAAGLMTVGAGATREEATAPLIVTRRDVVLGFLAYDATAVARPADGRPGVASWDEAAAVEAVTALDAQADVVIVSIHGGSEYLPTNDPYMTEIAQTIVAAGADVVWGHGAHVIQPIRAIAADRPAVVATSLGNFVFDQSGRERTTGALLEVLADAAGVIAYRVALTNHATGRIDLVEWMLPDGDAVWLDGAWWTLTRPPAAVARAPAQLAAFRHGDLVAAEIGDASGTGDELVVASFRRPFVETDLMRLRPDVQWMDAAGRSAHLGVYRGSELAEVWVAGTVMLPIADLAVCRGALALAHDSLDDNAIGAGGAWEWSGFGFTTAPELPGGAVPRCADVDGDGRTEPVIVGR